MPLVTLPPTLASGDPSLAVTALQKYFAPLGDKAGFAGGQWDSFDPSGGRAGHRDSFTADDLLACSLLSAPIGGRATYEILGPQHAHLARHLREIGPDRDFVTVTSTHAPEFAPVRSLYRALVGIPGVGLTRATKLMARKRPRLVPIVDSVLRTHVFGGGDQHWQPLLEELQRDDHALWHRLEQLHTEAGLDEQVSTLRVFDVLAWLDGTQQTETVVEVASVQTGPNEPEPDIN